MENLLEMQKNVKVITRKYEEDLKAECRSI